MTDHDDGISRRYRSLAREEPSAALDHAILAKARGRTPVLGDRARPASSDDLSPGVRPRFSMRRCGFPLGEMP